MVWAQLVVDQQRSGCWDIDDHPVRRSESSQHPAERHAVGVASAHASARIRALGDQTFQLRRYLGEVCGHEVADADSIMLVSSC